MGVVRWLDSDSDDAATRRHTVVVGFNFKGSKRPLAVGQRDLLAVLESASVAGNVEDRSRIELESCSIEFKRVPVSRSWCVFKIDLNLGAKVEGKEPNASDAEIESVIQDKVCIGT